MRLWTAVGLGGAVVLLILLMLAVSVRVTKLDTVEPVQWDCLASHDEGTPPPMPSH